MWNTRSETAPEIAWLPYTQHKQHKSNLAALGVIGTLTNLQNECRLRASPA
jgi:hypothetical protein